MFDNTRKTHFDLNKNNSGPAEQGGSVDRRQGGHLHPSSKVFCQYVPFLKSPLNLSFLKEVTKNPKMYLKISTLRE